MAYTFETLPLEFRRRIYAYACNDDPQTARLGSLVSKDFTHFCFAALHHDLTLEAHAHDFEVGQPDDTLASIVSFPALIEELRGLTHLVQVVRRLTLRGPSEARRLEFNVAGVGLLYPTLTCCDIFDLLSLMVNVDCLVLTEVCWDNCRRQAMGSCVALLARRPFRSLDIRFCYNQARGCHPFDILSAGSSYDSLALGYVEGWNGQTSALKGTVVNKLTLRDVGMSPQYTFRIMADAKRNCIQSLIADAVCGHNIHELSKILRSHAHTLCNLSLEIKANRNGMGLFFPSFGL